jgi:hypothetical protein
VRGSEGAVEALWALRALMVCCACSHLHLGRPWVYTRKKWRIRKGSGRPHRRYALGRLANHSFNLSSAFPRCEILFFSLLSISAYVFPSYSKHESQPAHRRQQLHCLSCLHVFLVLAYQRP